MKIRIIRRGVSFSANVQELNQNDVVSRIGVEAYHQIKASDAHPMFVELEVGREGESWGAVLLGGIKKSMRKVWGKARIQELASYLNSGVPLTFRHGDTNDLDGRDKVGRTIKGWVEDGSKAVAKAIAYIPSSAKSIQEMVRNKVCDICSIEADLQFAVSGNEGVGLIVDKVLNLSAVALGRSGVDGVPGFAGAGVVGAVQEMAKLQDLLSKDLLESDVEIVDGGKVSRRGGKMEGLTVGQVKAWIADMGIGPEKLFGLEDMLRVPAVKDAVESEVDEQMQAAGKASSKEVETLKAELLKREEAVKAKDAETATYREKLRPFELQTRATRLADVVKKSELMKGSAEAKAAYVARRIAAGLPEDADLSKDETGSKIEALIKSELKDIQDLGITFGGGNGNGAGAGGEAGAGGAAGGSNEVETARKMFEAGINPLEPGARDKLAKVVAR